MKRIVLAGVAALAVTLACQQKASAWGWQFNGNIGISIGASFQCYGDCYCPPTCWSACPGYCYGGYGGYDYGYPAPVYAAAPAAYASYPYYAATAQPQAPAVARQPAVEPAGYYYGGSYAYGNYGSYQAPGYWYGR